MQALLICIALMAALMNPLPAAYAEEAPPGEPIAGIATEAAEAEAPEEEALLESEDSEEEDAEEIEFNSIGADESDDDEVPAEWPPAERPATEAPKPVASAQPLKVKVEPAEEDGSAGMAFDIAIDGGLKPYDTYLDVYLDGEAIYSQEGSAERFTYRPPKAGKYILLVQVFDALDGWAEAEIAFTAAEPEEPASEPEAVPMLNEAAEADGEAPEPEPEAEVPEPESEKEASKSEPEGAAPEPKDELEQAGPTEETKEEAEPDGAPEGKPDGEAAEAEPDETDEAEAEPEEDLIEAESDGEPDEGEAESPLPQVVEKQVAVPSRGVTVTVRYWTDSGIPAEAALVVTMLTDADGYSDYYERAEAALDDDETLEAFILMDVSLLANGLDYAVGGYSYEVEVTMDDTLQAEAVQAMQFVDAQPTFLETTAQAGADAGIGSVQFRPGA